MRKSTVRRNTAETRITVTIDIDGRGRSSVDTSVPFLDHMLTLFSKHSSSDLKVAASGDIEVDAHHLVEDAGITLGSAIKEALGKKAGIARYGNFLMPMDEAISYVAVDLSGRPHLSFDVKFLRPSAGGREFDYSLIKEFFKALVSSSGITLHIKNAAGETNHHIAESVFKGFARAFAQAAARIPGRRGVPSTKKIL
ncbi:MAG: imidazoleglycerol-phosphate dehydratase HisB [Elusimicrobia bacterium HGW-Elusimicrobia-1]|jgi:imidazoleglycerol-phosphate dehydratase|nr:MAG: imidazoleglycerol-phosphate dehydratase HisB [Elusimicrobia bacterium HGW-Elusimicrobia-1]